MTEGSQHSSAQIEKSPQQKLFDRDQKAPAKDTDMTPPLLHSMHIQFLFHRITPKLFPRLEDLLIAPSIFCIARMK